MLTRKQWLWFADHHGDVRRWSKNILMIALMIYVFLILKTIWDKGKAPIPYAPATSFRTKFDCDEKIGRYRATHPELPIPKIQDASLFRLERHYTYTFYADWALEVFPECLGASLADSENDPNPFVIVIYDSKTNQQIYRIVRIGPALKQ